MYIAISNRGIEIIKNSHDLSIYNDGEEYSYQNHRIDGPAIEYTDGDETWWSEDDYHRKYGPARKWRSGDEWYFEGVIYTQEEFMEKFL